MEHQQLGAAGRRRRAERCGPGPDRLRRAQHLKRAGDVRHRRPPYARRGAICSTSMDTPAESSPVAVYTAVTAIGPFAVISRNPIVIGMGDAASPPKRISAIRQQSSMVAVCGGRTILSSARGTATRGLAPDRRAGQHQGNEPLLNRDFLDPVVVDVDLGGVAARLHGRALASAGRLLAADELGGVDESRRRAGRYRDLHVLLRDHLSIADHVERSGEYLWLRRARNPVESNAEREDLVLLARDRAEAAGRVDRIDEGCDRSRGDELDVPALVALGDRDGDRLIKNVRWIEREVVGCRIDGDRGGRGAGWLC